MTITARRLATPSSVNAAIKQIADVMRRANYAGALQYVPEVSWILFLRILDEREELEADEADAVGVPRSRRLDPARGGRPDAPLYAQPGLRGPPRTPEELLDIIEAQGREVDAAIAELRRLLAQDS